ncbi:MAG: hypothetical protein J6Z36_03215, partial [Clostridia bacterium]|nr:hypothetical protein [Clostridia bacterium]
MNLKKRVKQDLEKELPTDARKFDPSELPMPAKRRANVKKLIATAAALTLSAALIVGVVAPTVYSITNPFLNGGNMAEAPNSIDENSSPDFSTDDSAAAPDAGAGEGYKPDEKQESTIIQDGYSNGGASEPTNPFWCAYQMDRVFTFGKDTDCIPVRLSFGTDAHHLEVGFENCDSIVVSVTNQDNDEYILEELTAEEYFTEKYEVQIDYT